MSDIDKDICWVLSNIAASPSADIVLEILNNDYLIMEICRCASSSNQVVVKEACYVIANMLALQDINVMETAIKSKGIFDLIIPMLAFEN
jgi:hypothetical protein